MDDFVFGYSFEKNSKKYLHFNEFMKDNLLNILSFCELYDCTGERLNVSSFRLKHPGESRIDLFDDYQEKVLKNTQNTVLSEDEKALDASEPRISYIIKTLKMLSALVLFYNNHNRCEINRIELNDCRHWILKEHNHASSVYQYLAATCNANCKFCYLQANPVNIRIGKKEKNADCSWNELQTRINYFGDETNLFTPNYEIKEFFNSPYFEKTLIELRKKSNDDFMFVTNGSLLTAEKIKFLSTILPVTVIISVVVISGEKRSEILFNESVNDESDKFNHVMMKSFPLLNKYKVPFIGSITAWPSIKYDDFIETIHYIEKFNPVAIRINMLGYCERNMPNISKETDVPLIPIPSQYYINEFQENVLDVQVMGVIRNSPAYGLVFRGDVIKKINNIVVTSRDQLLDALSKLSGEKTLSIVRDNKELEVTIGIEDKEKYPYAGTYYGKYRFPYGMVIPESIQLKQVKEVLNIMDNKRKKNAILIVGPLVKKSVLKYFSMLGGQIDKTQTEIHFEDKVITIACSYNYFLGGNIQIMDMCVITDFMKVVEDNKNSKTDIVIMPDSMFNVWGNDLLGVNKDSFEHCIGITVEYFNAKTVPY